MTDVPLLFDPKTPGDVVDRTLDFTAVLNRGETISTTDVSSTPSGLSLSTPTISTRGNMVTTWVGGGIADTSYYVNYHIVTTGGRDETRSAILNVKTTVP